MVYVGQASRNTKPLARILQHMNTQASTKEKYYDYWQLALIFVCKNTNPADQWGTDTIDDLEALLIKDTQVECSWNSKEERIRNPLSLDRIRSHSRKLLDIREYVNNLEFNFFNKADKHENSSNTTYEERLDAEEKQLIDNTVNLTTINLEPTASVPEYTTPESVVNQMLDSLPWEEFNEATKFFDPACKGGEFLALIHDRMMKRLYEIGYKSDLAEPVSIQYIYSNSTYNTSGTDTLEHEYSAGDPLPAGSDPDSAEATPTIYCATAKRLAIYQQARHQFPYCSANADNGGTYTYKFLNMALPWSMCLEHEQEVASYAGGATWKSNQHDTICRPLCGQTQAFWSADKRNGGGAVENRTA